MDISLQLIIILAFMLIGAVVAVESRDMLAAVICMGLVAFGTSVAFLVLGAPDLAITQLVVEIICLVILIRATLVREEPVSHHPVDTFSIMAGAVALTALLAVCAYVYTRPGTGRGLPSFGDPVALRPYDAPGAARSGERGVSRLYLDESWRYLKARQAGQKNPVDITGQPSGNNLHVANRVCALILDYRGYDTLGEATVIFTGIMGALAILRKRGRFDGRNEPDS